MREAIEILRSCGMTLAEAEQEFNDRVNYNMRGTGYTLQDREYAIEETAYEIIHELY